MPHKIRYHISIQQTVTRAMCTYIAFESPLYIEDARGQSRKRYFAMPWTAASGRAHVVVGGGKPGRFHL